MKHLHRLSMMGATALVACSAANAQAGADAASQPATAVTPQAGNPPAVPQAGGLQDIVVTARRSAETLQSVPVAITALTGQFLERQNIVDATSLPRFAPSLTIAQQTSSVSAAAVFIRGIGNNEPSSVADQGVGIYLDGVYLARAAGALFDLVDVERVEVLRGPQGTLFGRNTIGGAVQLITRKPTDELHVEAKAGYGRFNDWFVRSRVDTGYLGESGIKVSVAAQHRQSDGYINNVLASSSKDPGSLNGNSVLAAVQGDFGDLKVNYNFDFDDRRGAPPFFQILATSPDVLNYYSQSPGFGGAPFQIGQDRLNDVQQAGFTDQKGKFRFRSRSRVSGHSLTLAYEVAPVLTIKSITGYRRFYQNSILQLTGNGDLKGVVLDPVTFAPSIQSVLPYNGNNAPQRQHQFSQELQALGSSGDLTYLAGVYFFRERASENNQQALTFVLPGGMAGLNLLPLQAFGGTSRSVAGFGQVSYKPSFLDQKLELTGGIRYTEDRKTIYLAGDVQPTLRGRAKFDNVSWLASASYRFDRDLMVYARASTGYRSGGFNPRTAVINEFAPEKARAYEAGIKSELLDRKLRLNLAGFLTSYDNLQVNQFAAGTGGATSLVVNAGKAKIKGFEVEATAAPIDGFSVDGSVGYVDVNYKQFLFRNPLTNVISDVAARAKQVYTPKWTAHVGGEYSHDLGIGTGRARLDYSYRSTLYYNALDDTAPFNEAIRSRPDKNLRGRISLENIDLGGSKLDIGIWGDNLTNQKNLAYSIDFGSLGLAGGIFKKPVTYGADAKIVF